MTHQAGDGAIEDVVSSLLRLSAEAAAGLPPDPVAMMAALVRVQRATASGLRSAVALGRAQGLSWRELAEMLDIPASTLHRQYRQGATITTSRAGVSPSVADAPVVVGVPPSADLFVGRQRELGDVAELLNRRRVVTLVGPAGVGKTRLAAAIAHRVEAEYPGGVWWVDLAAVTQERLISSATSAAAGPAHAGRDPGDVAAESASAGAVLLVMDNCEHLLTATARFITRLQAAAPRLRVLATSREALRAAGEAIMPLAPFPSAREQRRTARGAEAVMLFAARARDVRPDFDVDAWADVIVEICDELDGLPLAIELAAHQSDLITPDNLLSKLEARFEVLTDAPRGANGRHHSLRSAIRWGYDLLDEVTRAVFGRLCILPGGFDQQTAAAVTHDLGLSPVRLWAVLADLARKSMVVIQSSRPGRFRMLASLRAFGQEALTADQLRAAQVGLVEWLASLNRRLAENPWGDALTAQDNQMADEVENVRYGVDVAADLGHAQRPAVVVLLAHILGNRGELAESNRLLAVVALNPQASTADRASAVCGTAINLSRLGDHEAAIRHAYDAVDLARQADDVDILTSALITVMTARGVNKDVAGGIGVGAELISQLRATSRIGSLARALTIQGALLAAHGDTGAAHEAFSEAITLHEKQADQTPPMSERFGNRFAALLLYGAADLAVLRGDDATATEYITAILTSRYHHHHAVVGALYCAATLALRRGQNARALTLAVGATQFGYQHIGFRGAQLEAVTETAERAVGAATTRAATESGRALTIAELKRFALHDSLPSHEDRSGVLTTREYEVAHHVSRGQTNAQIAARLSISERTVASHLARIREKLDLHSRVDVALWATRTANRS